MQYEGEELSPIVFYTGAAPSEQAISALEYLMAKSDATKFRDPEKGDQAGMRQFLDEKSYRPGLQTYERNG